MIELVIGDMSVIVDTGRPPQCSGVIAESTAATPRVRPHPVAYPSESSALATPSREARADQLGEVRRGSMSDRPRRRFVNR
jgi:hypothetical protein